MPCQQLCQLKINNHVQNFFQSFFFIIGSCSTNFVKKPVFLAVKAAKHPNSRSCTFGH